MPTYEYACEACGHHFEREQRISEDPIKECPKCGKPKASRMISAGNFILKGGGWYADLYSGPSNKGKGKGKGKGGSGGGEKASSDSSSSKSETKKSDTSPKKSDTKKAKAAAS